MFDDVDVSSCLLDDVDQSQVPEGLGIRTQRVRSKLNPGSESADRQLADDQGAIEPIMRAAARVFLSRQPMVIGPVPPGIGVIAPAMS